MLLQASDSFYLTYKALWRLRVTQVPQCENTLRVSHRHCVSHWHLLIFNCRGLPDDAFHDLDMGEGLEGMRKETKEKAQKGLEEMKKNFTPDADTDLDKELANAPKVLAAILRKNPAQVRKELEDDSDWVTSVK